MNIYIDYNKELLKTRGTLIYFDNDPIHFSSKLYKYIKSELNSWSYALIPTLISELNDDEFTIEFYGNFEDYKLLLKEIEKFKNENINIRKLDREKFRKVDTHCELNPKEKMNYKTDKQINNLKEKVIINEVKVESDIDNPQPIIENDDEIFDHSDEEFLLVPGGKFIILKRKTVLDKKDSKSYKFSEVVDKISTQNLIEFLEQVCETENEEYYSLIKIERVFTHIKGVRFRVEQIIINSYGEAVYANKERTLVYGKASGCLLLSLDIMQLLSGNDILIFKILLSGE